jgi:hypothetical protein
MPSAKYFKAKNIKTGIMHKGVYEIQSINNNINV